MNFPPLSAPKRRAAAFSLIEVALALGVVAFAFVGLLALLPAGLNNFRTSMNISIGAQIFQRVLDDAEQSDFDNLATSTGPGFTVLPTRYFDDEGNEVVPASGAALSPKEAQKVVYHVRVRSSNVGPADTSADGATYFMALPSASSSASAYQGPAFNPRYSTILTVQVAVNPSNMVLQAGSDQLWSPTQTIPSNSTTTSVTIPMTTYSAVVTRNGWSAPTTSS